MDCKRAPPKGRALREDWLCEDCGRGALEHAAHDLEVRRRLAAAPLFRGMFGDRVPSWLELADQTEALQREGDAGKRWKQVDLFAHAARAEEPRPHGRRRRS